MPHNLLLADDSVTIQRVIELTFADEDIDVVAVSNGDQAIARLDAVPPDILLVDVGMPGMSGYEVAAYVKQTAKLAHIPVVLLTGAFEPIDQARASAAGCDGVLAKPFEPQQVIGRVKELLGRTSRAASPVDDGYESASGAAGELWPAATVAHAAAEPAAGARRIDDYFDQLDAAFTNLAGKPAAEVSAVRQPPPMPVDVDWFGLKPATGADEAADVSIRQDEAQPFWPRESTGPSITPAVDDAETQPASGLSGAAPPPVSSPPSDFHPLPPTASAPQLPPLADAFAALLEAEQGQPEPVARPAWPTAGGGQPAVSDDLVDRVSRRVLEQLTDRAVRDAVTDTVSAIAERLVREEIERIKASIT